MADHPGADPKQLATLDPDLRRFLYCGAEEPGGAAAVGSATSTDASSTAGGSSEGIDAQGGARNEDLRAGAAKWSDIRKGGACTPPLACSKRLDYSSLCSHSELDSERGVRSPCYYCQLGTTVSHGVPGGAACCGTRADLSRCPRAWA